VPTEKWRPVVGFAGAYAVSNLGRVKSLERQVRSGRACGGDGWRTVPEKLLKPILWGPYWAVHLSQQGIVRRRRIHELVLTAFVGQRPKGKRCRHLDGDLNNNALTNLRWGTHQENEADKALHGTTANGQRNGNSKLTEDQVRQILHSPKIQSEVAKQFGISQAWVSKLRRREVWRHIK
jgi:hypothetical protein